MKIGLFLAPSEQTLYSGISIPPHTLGVLTAYLRGENHTVNPYDLNTDLLDHYFDQSLSKEDMAFIFKKETVLKYLQGEDNREIDRFVEKLLADKPLETFEAVGVSLGGSFYWMPIHAGFIIAKYIKKKYRIPVIVGGNNLFYLFLFRDVYRELWVEVLKSFRFIVLGSAMDSLHKIIQRLDKNPRWVPSVEERSQFKGLVYEKEGNVYHEPKDKNRVTKPDFKGLRLDYYMNFIKDPQLTADPAVTEQKNLEQLFKWPTHLIQYANQVYRKREKGGFIKKLTLPYVFNYHCPYQCAFCAESDSGNKVVMGDPVKVVDDIEALTAEYDTPYVYFYNNYFNLSKTFVNTFCDEVKKRKLKFYWQDCARFDNLDLELMQKMKESGCVTLWFGMETGGEKLMKMLNKKLDLKTIHRGLNLCKKTGILANLEMIVGFPHETREDFMRTVMFIKKNAPKINFFQNNRYFVVPNSTLGKFPEGFEVEIVKNVITYDSLLQDNLDWFFSSKGLGHKPNNFHIYTFNEINGRGWQENVDTGYKRLMHMHQLQSKEFTEIRQMLILLDIIQKRKAG